MKQAYDLGSADRELDSTCMIQAYVAGASERQVDAVSKAKAEIINEIQIKNQSSRRMQDLEYRAEFIVVDGKVVKDRSETGCWPPTYSARSPLPVGVKDLRPGARVFARSPAGFDNHEGKIDGFRTNRDGQVEYHVTFVGKGGADWYVEYDLSNQPKLGQPPTTGHTFSYMEMQRVPGDLTLPVERNGRFVVDVPEGQEDMAKRAADAYREQMKQADAQRDAAIAKLGQSISEMPGVTEDVLRETLADIQAQAKTKEKP